MDDWAGPLAVRRRYEETGRRNTLSPGANGHDKLWGLGTVLLMPSGQIRGGAGRLRAVSLWTRPMDGLRQRKRDHAFQNTPLLRPARSGVSLFPRFSLTLCGSEPAAWIASDSPSASFGRWRERASPFPETFLWPARFHRASSPCPLAAHH